MALIELNLEKPALKRVESGEKQQSESGSGLLGGHESSSSESEKSSQQKSESSKQSQSKSEQSQSSSQQSGGKSRIRKYGRRMAILGGTAAGVAAARKIRKRQKSGGQQNLEEDWQTAETSSSSGSGSQSSGSQSSGSQ